MNSSELRQKFLDFFKKHGHTIVPSSSLLPTDPSVLFTTAGMQPLIPYLLGEKHLLGKKLVSIQKCLRTDDIDEVGDDTHNTFFEMLGNWSLGDYWKKDSIRWSLKFLTEELGLSKERLAVSYFAGDNIAPPDIESAEIWESLGIEKEKIIPLPKKDNWWGPVGNSGPCGPDTEIFYWKSNNTPAPKTFDPKDGNWVEVWNNVFMEYIKNERGNYTISEQQNVDTGMGLERTLAVINGKESIYETDLFESIISEIENLQTKKEVLEKEYNEQEYVFTNISPYNLSIRIITDHIRASVFLIADGVIPSNKREGSVLRRLIRRSIVFGKKIGIQGSFTSRIAKLIIKNYENFYRELKENESIILNELDKEEKEFEPLYVSGIKELEEIIKKTNAEVKFAVNWPPADMTKVSEYTINALKPEKIFNLHQSKGFNLELINDLLVEHALFVDKNEFLLALENFKEKLSIELQKQKELSRTSSAGMFKGGLADDKPETIKLHTAHHLLLAALQQLFGKQVKQRGSNINSERLRIDFSFDRKLTDEEKKKIEDIVNDKIKEGLDVTKKEIPKEEAEKIGAESEFGVKYGNTVSVYFIQDKKGNAFSKEFCGGPHAASTDELGRFKIVKEEAVSSGVRRIRAVLQDYNQVLEAKK